MKTTVAIQGMHCNACVQRLTEAFQKVPGVSASRVSLSPPQAEIESDGPVSLDSLGEAARSVGDYAVSQHLSANDSVSMTAEEGVAQPSLYPLVLIVGYIAGSTALATFFRGDATPQTFMLDFMAGFFLVFSFFKLLDLRGFADAYQSYDIVAKRSMGYAMAYPFMELALGIAYLLRWQLTVTNLVTLTIMLVSSIGVIRAVLDKRRIRCACLGTALKLPMTTVTIVEDLGMAAMALIMLVWRM